MESEHRKTRPRAVFLQLEIVADGRLLRDGQEMAERIDHDVANEKDGFAGAALFEEMIDGVFFGDEEIVGDGVSEDAVDFLGHRAIEAAQAGFDVGYGNAELYGGQGDGDGGVDVADHEDEIGLAFEEDWLDASENFGGLRGVRAGADFEIDVGLGDAHLAEEDVGELFVIVLAGVNEDGVDFGMAAHFAEERSDFGEVGTGSDDVEDFEALGHWRRFSGLRR